MGRNRAWAGAIACLAVALLAACTSDTGPSSSYLGAWEGMTSQGMPIQFWVESDGARLVVTTDSIVGTTCNSYLTIFFASDPPDTAFHVVGNTISLSATGTSGTVTVAGTFNSATTASGTLTRTHTACGASGSTNWTATRVTAPAVNVTGTWSGTFSSSVISPTQGTFALTQAGSSLSGTWTFANGGTGTLSGTVAGNMAKFSVTETTAGCSGSFTGHASRHLDPEFMFLAWAGTDCLGTHRHAGGMASRVP